MLLSWESIIRHAAAYVKLFPTHYTSSYSGGTQIQAGELKLTGALSHASNTVTVGGSGTIGGVGTIAGNLHFNSGAKLLIVNLSDPLDVGGTVTFGGFSIANLISTGGFDLDWDTMALDTPYTLISGTVNTANLANLGASNATPVGSMGRSAYFQSGSLQLVVIPEPATFGIVLSVLAAAVIRRRRFG